MGEAEVEMTMGRLEMKPKVRVDKKAILQKEKFFDNYENKENLQAKFFDYSIYTLQDRITRNTASWRF